MEVTVDIRLEQLIQLVKKLPAKQLDRLKAELDINQPKTAEMSGLKDFLLKAPTFNSKQLDIISETRKSINKWRVK